MSVRITAAVVGAWLVLLAGQVEAQGTVEARVETGAPSLLPFQEEDVSPGGAFLRSLLLPGWGHVATGAPGRGALYVAAQSGSLWMLWKSSARRSLARSLSGLEREVVRARLERQGITNPATLFALVEEDPAVEEWDTLLETRGQQVEDWAAMSIFLVLMGAADAYVTAHLRDFPEPLSLRVVSNPASGGVDLGLSVLLGGRASAGP